LGGLSAASIASRATSRDDRAAAVTGVKYPAAKWNPAILSSIDASKARRNAAMFWIYWDTAWSIILGGIMFTTIVTHPDAEFVEVQLQSRAYPRTREL
jgi:hypothetical protein